MPKTAILVDGGFYKKVAKKLWGKEDAKPRADELFDYAVAHISKDVDGTLEGGKRSLYRIFYYDCPPIEGRKVHRPWDGTDLFMDNTTKQYKWETDFLNELSHKRKVALRLGTLSAPDPYYTLSKTAIESLLDGSKTIHDLKWNDYVLTGVDQKGVDMRIGLDVASLASQRIVDQIILISGDSDFIPAVKTARRAGIDFILDSMGNHIKNELTKHVDGIETLVDEKPWSDKSV